MVLNEHALLAKYEQIEELKTTLIYPIIASKTKY